jgi:hypothetical protein
MHIIAGLALAIVAAWMVFPGRIHLQRWALERRYKAAGYRMQRGCNGAWANQAMFRLFSISNDIEELQRAQIPDTNELRRLQEEYVAAQKEDEFRREDCRKRGHVDTIPVKILSNAPPK